MGDLYQQGRDAMDKAYRDGTKVLDDAYKTYNQISGNQDQYTFNQDAEILGMSLITFIAVVVSVAVVVIVLICVLCCWCCHCCCCARHSQQVVVYPPNPNNNPGIISTTTYAPLQSGPAHSHDPGFVNQLYSTQQRGNQGFSDDELLEVECNDSGRQKNRANRDVPLSTLGSG